MKILMYSNMYPTKKMPYAGIFIKNQFQEITKLLDNNDSIEMVYMANEKTSKLNSIIKYFLFFIKFFPYFFKRFDILHLQFFFPLGLFIPIYKLFNKNTKIVVTFLGLDATGPVYKGFTLKVFKYISSKYIDTAIPVGKTLDNIVKNKFKVDNTKIISCGVNNNIFKKHDVIKEYDYIFVGYLIKRKGIDTLIKSIKMFTPNNCPKICFVGTGEFENDVVELMNEYPISHFVNKSQTEVALLLNKSKYFVFPTRNEGFANASIEAMFCGLPVLSSNIPQMKEQITEAYNGWMVELDNAKALKNKMEELANISNEEYRKLSENAFNSFKNISLTNVSKEIIKQYKEITAN